MAILTEVKTEVASQQLTGDGKTKEQQTNELLSQLQSTNTLPLWAQMSKLNPPAPNPTCIPHIWKYDEIKPYLLRAGELITEKQAERRVLMLVNPARGKPSQFIVFKVVLSTNTSSDRCALHHRYCVCWPSAGYAQ